MKKILFILIFFFALTQTTFANDHTFMFGLRISDGATLTYGKDSQGAFDMSGSSFIVNTSFQFQLSKPFSVILSPGLQFDFLESTEQNHGADMDFDFNFIYLDLPLFARFNFGRGFAEVGPQLNFNLSGKSSSSVYDDSNDIEFMNDFELAASLGGGYRFKFGLEIDARLQLGLTNIFDDSTMNDDVSKWTIGLGISYWFLH